MKTPAIAILCVSFAVSLAAAQEVTPKWDVFELALKRSAAGNPLAGTDLRATFRNGGRSYSPEAFYDGNGVFKIRFRPA